MVEYTPIEGSLVVNEALSWVGTPFHGQASLKKIGCDCLGLILGVGANLNAISHTTGKRLNMSIVQSIRPNYNYLYDGHILCAELGRYLYQKLSKNAFNTLSDACILQKCIVYGDVLIFEFGKTHFHLGIVSNVSEDSTISIVHACLYCGKVVEHTLKNGWKLRCSGVYQFVENVHNTP